MSKNTRSNILLISVAIAIVVGLFFFVNMRSTLIVTNPAAVEHATTTTQAIVESELEKSIKEIQSRPDVQKQFYNLAKEIHLTERRNAIAEELKNAESELETHKAESTSF